jgi:hypothetical protein
MLSQQNWGYFTRFDLALSILIIPGCCKNMEYKGAVLSGKNEDVNFVRFRVSNPGPPPLKSDVLTIMLWTITAFKSTIYL